MNAAHHAPAYAPSPAPQFESGESRVDLWGALLRRSWLIIFLGVVGTGLGYLQYLKQPPTYSSTARILLVREGPPELPVQGVGARDVVEGLANQTLLIRSPKVLEKAVKDGKLTECRTLSTDPATCAGLIAGGIAINSVHEQSTMLDLTYSGRDPADCQKIVNAIAEAFQSYLGDSRQDVSKETVGLIDEARKNLASQLEAKEAAYRKFRSRSTLLAAGRTEGINIHAARVAQIEGVRSQLLVSRTQTRAELQAIENALKTSGSREALALMLEKSGRNANVGGEAPVRSLTEILFPLLLEEQLLLGRHGPDHPEVKTLRKKIEITRSFLQNPAGTPGEKSSDAVASKGTKPQPRESAARDFLDVYVESLRQELKSSEQKEIELDAMFEEEREAARGLSAEELEDETHRADIARTQALFDAVVKRLQEVTLIKDTGGYSLDVVSRASYGWRTGPDLSKALLLGGCGGMLLGFVFAYLLELADKSFRSSSDIMQELGLRVVGHVPNIPNLDSPDGGIDGRLCTLLKPRSVTAEAFRGIRNNLFFCTQGERHKVIQITSPDPSDGKSTLSCNLAVVIAQSGKKVLLVDADFRRPRVHSLFNVSSDEGLSTVIMGQCDVVDALQDCDIPNLSLLVCGPKPDNPSELLTLPRFEELLQTLREKFDYVIIDSPPMLAVSDPSAVAARADGVILAVRIRKNGRRSAVQAAQMLHQIGARVVGVVVNGVAPSNSGYYAYQGPYQDEVAYYGMSPYGGYYEDEELPPPRSMTARGGSGQLSG